MGYWGWRPLMICLCISVWVAGCNIVTESAPGQVPTPSPLVTLTIRRISTPTATASPTAVTRATSVRPSPAPGSAQSSPTPIIYIVRSGDTFGDLALRFGVDLGALIDANRALDPRALQPGQTIVIPAPPSGSATPTSTPPTLRLAPPTCYETPINRVLCLGTVENTLDHPLEQVKLVAQIFRADGSTIDTQPIDVEQSVIPAGMSAPYRAEFGAAIGDVAGAEAQLQRADAALNVDQRYLSLEVQQQTSSSDHGRVIVTATLRNSGAVGAQDIRLIATLFDTSGAVIGYRVMDVPDTLAAGDRLPIRVEIVPQVMEPTPTVTLYVEARPVVETPTP